METLLSTLAFAAFLAAQVIAVIAVSAEWRDRPSEPFGTTPRGDVSRLVRESILIHGE